MPACVYVLVFVCAKQKKGRHSWKFYAAAAAPSKSTTTIKKTYTKKPKNHTNNNHNGPKGKCVPNIVYSRLNCVLETEIYSLTLAHTYTRSYSAAAYLACVYVCVRVCIGLVFTSVAFFIVARSFSLALTVSISVSLVVLPVSFSLPLLLCTQCAAIIVNNRTSI